MNQIIIDQNQNNGTLEVNVGDTILIDLKEIPTTGYRWKLDEVDEKIITLVDSKYTLTSDGIGGAGSRMFTFKTRSPGKTKICLDLKREWEQNVSPIDQFQVSIQVREKKK